VSMSAAARPASVRAARAASTARSEVPWPAATTRRSRIPVRSTIHSSLVSTRLARSALVTRCSGRAAPRPPNRTGRRVGATYVPRAAGSRATTVTRGCRSERPQPGDGLAFTDALTVVHEQAHHPPGEAGADGDAAALAVDVADDLAGVEDLPLRGDHVGLDRAELAQAGGDDDLFGNGETFPGEGGSGGFHHRFDRGHARKVTRLSTRVVHRRITVHVADINVRGREYRVEELAAAANVSVEVLRSYQSKGLLPAPRHEGREVRYGPHHLERLREIRDLKERGYSLKAIAGVLARGWGGGPAAPATSPVASPDDELLTLRQLSELTGVPTALLRSLEASGVLRPRRIESELRYTDWDVRAVGMLLSLLGSGLPMEE